MKPESERPELMQDRELRELAVVANCSMNRERGLSGVNSYSRELRFDLLEKLKTEFSSWLDLCCGQGLALKDAAAMEDLVLVGVDLLPPPNHPGVQFVASPVLDFNPGRDFDLITSIHGLHYLGDKLAALSLLSSWLTRGGLFYGHLDLNNIRGPGGKKLSRTVLRCLREAGYAYNPRTHLITGSGLLDFPLRYIGCDPKAGPNYTGQPAVDSYYTVP